MYKIIEVTAAAYQEVHTTNTASIEFALGNPEFKGHVLHSVVPVQRDGNTTEFLLVLEKTNEDSSAYDKRGIRKL